MTPADRPTIVERDLWLAVVRRVLEDGLGTADLLPGFRARMDDSFARAEARRWLVLDFGTWAEDREEVCTLAGLDPDAIRDLARRRLALVKMADAERGKRRKAALQARADQLYRRLDKLLASNNPDSGHRLRDLALVERSLFEDGYQPNA